VTYDLFSALAHCHEHGVLHRDVKPGNLLVSSSGIIQLCDFGLAKPFLDEHNTPLPVPISYEQGTKGLCTLFYRPPEILLGGPANHPAIDIYSAGTVLAELVSGRPLFEGHNVVEQLSLVYDHLGTPTDNRWPTARQLPDYGKLDFISREPMTWSQTLPRVMECKHLSIFLDRVVALDPLERMSAVTALEHPLLCDQINNPSLRQMLVKEAIPPSLSTPPLIAPDDKVTMTRLALAMAENRRAFFSKHASSWSGADLPITTVNGVTF